MGSVDEVVQIDSTYSIASLVQRVGRSGRRDGQPSEILSPGDNKATIYYTCKNLAVGSEIVLK